MNDADTPPDSGGSEFEDSIRRFEVAWRGRERPDIAAYLPDGPGRGRLLVELVHVDLEYRLRAGEAARVEHYLDRFPALADDRQTLLGLVAAEYELRRRAEPGLALDEHLQRFPQYRDELPVRIARSTIAGLDAPLRPVGGGDPNPPEVPGYEIVGLIGRGGMGVVYKARQQSLDRPVALKFLPEECAQDPGWLNRFRREAATASALNHPNICTIYDTGECAGRPFLSMEFVEGRTLADMIRRRPSVDEAVRLIRQAARALAAAHAAGVVHRDIKPQNLMARADGIVKVLDFGLARRLPTLGAPGSSRDSDTGTRVGTVLYMSPEQSRYEPVGTPSDVFSLGIVTYELVTGKHPFLVADESGATDLVADQPPLPMTSLNPEAPKPLNALVQLMLAADAGQRPSAAEVDATLAELSTAVTNGARHRDNRRHSVTVGRDPELAVMRREFESAAAGRGAILCLAGEPGLGKTTLVEHFLDELASGERPWRLALGRCSERLAGTEAYLPFLEALDSLLEADGGVSVARALKLLAPTWYARLAPRAPDDPTLSAVLAATKEASQERLKREFSAFVEHVSRQYPLMLFLDDVHWADPSSVDLLAYLGGKCADLPVLVVLTYRPSDLWRSQHPFGPVKLDLQTRGVCREIELPFLNRDDFDRYLALAFAGHDFPGELATVLHARTEGSPLFMVDLLRYLRDRGVIVQEGGRWSLVRAVPDLQHELPASVRGMIRRKVDQLGAADRQLLMAASVQGLEFDSAVVANVLGREPADVEERLDVLDRVHYMVRLVREQTFPDGTLTLRYGFVHALYQNALYAALQPTRKATWSAAAARALLDHHGDKSKGLAAELAMLFEAARDPERAADHYLAAAENAARIFAHHEAVALAKRGLLLVETLPETPDRARRELPLQVTLGIQLQVVQGYAAPEAERTYDRARAVCEQTQDAPQLFLVLWGLWMLYEVRSDLEKSREFAERLLALARRANDRAQILQAHMALTVTSFSLGDLPASREHSEQGVALYDPALHGNLADIYGQDPKIAALAFGSVAMWLLGFPDQAVVRSREAVAVGAELGHPTTRALAAYFASMLRQYRREPRETLEWAEATKAVGAEHGLSLWLANGQVMRGWALAELGECADGIALMRQGIADWAETGAETHRTYFLGLLAEALGRAGQMGEALRVLDTALELMRGTGTVFYGAELHRLRGEFLMCKDAADVPYGEAEASIRRALDLARQQRAKSFELRAAVSLTRLLQKLGRQAEARPLLAECCEWFTEGLDTPDLRDAKLLLEQVG